MSDFPDLRNKRVLIIGGLGLIGSTTARYCIQSGAQVTIADNRAPDYGANDYNLADLHQKYSLEIGDVRESTFVDTIVKGQDFIFNFAAQVNHNVSIEKPILDNQINCIGHINVLMACRNYNQKAKIAYPGSRLQYGKILHLPVAEDHPREPLSIYAIHKNTAEQYYQAFFKHYGIRSTCFRITNPYGPRSQMKSSGYSIINWFIRLALDNQTINVFGGGRQFRDYIYIDDLVDGLVRSTVQGETDGKVYNVGSGEKTRFIDMARTVVEVVGGGDIQDIPWPKNYDNFETGDFYADIESIKKDTDWEPSTKLRNGIEQTVSYYREHRSHYW
ncbi:MAG: NAD-dependent epimerase/dehydratase family protein [Patescibacteria group bacterium]|jgi:UDP-glucose 4-epimerase